MTISASNLVQRLWRYCNILRDDGLSYPDYVEQLTYLLFLKLAHERGDKAVPREFSWSSLVGKREKSLYDHYGRILKNLGGRTGSLGLIFRNARNKIKDPAKLRLLVVDLIDQTSWNTMSADIKGDAYEGLLEKNAQDTKSGAGQYFTPRPLVEAIVACLNPQPGELVCDPACGTGGFLLAAHEYVKRNNPNLKPSQIKHLKTKALRGIELVEEVARLAAMNLLLHGIGDTTQKDDLPILCDDSLQSPPAFNVDVVLTNPPFGTKGSVTFSGADNKTRHALTTVRRDFFVKSSNKQLNFIQHIMTLLKPTGRAAVVIPDNVLFETGAAATIRRKLFQEWEVHTLLRLPPGLFYAHGVKANVIFFSGKREPAKAAKFLWIYDLRQNSKFSVKTNPIQRTDLQDFVKCFHSPRDTESRNQIQWRPYSINDIVAAPGCSLDIRWVGGNSSSQIIGLDRLDQLAEFIESDLRQALTKIQAVLKSEKLSG